MARYEIEEAIQHIDNWLLAQPQMTIIDHDGGRYQRDLTDEEEEMVRKSDQLEELLHLNAPVRFGWTFDMWRGACPCAAI